MEKRDIIAAGRKIAESGMVAGTWGNISAWDSSREGYWITPSGMDYFTLGEEDLVLLSIGNVVLEGCRKPSSELLLHTEIYKQRPDVKGIVHTHSPYATAHAVARAPLPGIVEDMVMIVGGQVEVAPYCLPGTLELAQGAVNALQERSAVLLANHGLVGVGCSVEEALKVCQVVEKSAQIHIMSRLLGGPALLSQEDIQLMCRSYRQSYGQ
ncbi:ribulose-5-phosphate 4-epimerase-like epimerase or aldolase [Desulfitobacterium dichloroeliminans LMG P-21439]|uniref:Ribulose-5-phosphate 4-epimerase-like epimerase or aldolase n=1 Tax=Desulfitobacterium dichloroeliminans (strain LMG P-21439 / DCA1) TaxID=871963 RepID=L0F8D8_DESDL|nr:class II aldolase/adducin family protein [Desulfitobacterium dichloroeliminans]AGA70069.1 ribulose-5-phosphate 4-epimerase-like epimerase or aldolase [Desulfitobacterium dichloroeliminans LMG P-21439]